MLNTLKSKPTFTLHRRAVGSPVTADDTDLSNIDVRGSVHCGDWLVVDGYVKLAGGTSPTVSIVPLFLAKYEEADQSETEEYYTAGDVMGPYVDGDSFTVEVYRGKLFMRIDSVTGSPTSVKVMLGGAQKDNQVLGGRA